MVYRMNVPVYEFNETMKVQDIPTFVDILDPANIDSLVEPSPFPDDVITDLEEEFSIPTEELEPSHASFKKAVKDALECVESPSIAS